MNSSISDQNPYEAGTYEASTEANRVAPWRAMKPLVAMIPFAIGYGIISAIFPVRGPMVEAILSIPFIVLLIIWCNQDAAQKGFAIGSFTRLGLIFAFVITLPVYLIRTRGIRAVLSITLATLYTLGLGIVAAVMGFVTEYLMYGEIRSLP